MTMVTLGLDEVTGKGYTLQKLWGCRDISITLFTRMQFDNKICESEADVISSKVMLSPGTIALFCVARPVNRIP